MKSILNFKDSYQQMASMKAEVNYSENAIDQLINQFLKLSNQSNEVDGAFFLKNRSPLMKKNAAASIRNYSGKRKYGESLLNKELYFHKFPVWRAIGQSTQANQIDVLSDSPEPFDFGKDKSFLIASVRDEKYNWGFLVCFAEKGKNWDSQQINTIKSFSELLSTTMLTHHETHKNQLQLIAIHSRQNDKDRLILQLKNRIEEKNKLIKKIQDQNSLERSPKKVINFSDSKEEFDEIWLSIQGFKNGEEEPKLSKWEKISDRTLLSKVNELLHLNTTCANKN